MFKPEQNNLDLKEVIQDWNIPVKNEISKYYTVWW